MRNMDRSLANIEMIPGGFDAMQRVYHSIQEPLERAASESVHNRINSGQNSTKRGNGGQGDSEGLQGPTSSALPNPWARNGGNSQNLYGNSMQSPFSVFASPNNALRPPLLPQFSQITSPPAADIPFVVQYQPLLAELADMGFVDEDANLAALIEADGDLWRALDILEDDDQSAQ